MKRSFIVISILLGLALLASQCINEENQSCTYTPQGQVFSTCFDIETDLLEESKTACSNLSGSFANDSCTSQDRIIFCTGGNLNKPLQDVGSTSIDLGTINFSLYSGGSDVDRNNYCTSDLAGTVQVP